MKFKLCLWLMTIASSSMAADVSKLSISLKPSYVGERISIQPASADQTIDPATAKAILGFISDKKFIPENAEISAAKSDSDISFGFGFSYFSKAKTRFENCFVLWYEDLDSISAMKVAQYLFATDGMSEQDWKKYGSQISSLLKSSTDDGHKICAERKPRDQTHDMLYTLAGYFEKSSALTAEENQRISAFVEPVFTIMKSDITQANSAQILNHIKQWVENIRGSGIDSTRKIDFNELWNGKNLTKAELSGRALFRLISKEKIDSVTASKDVSPIYGVLLSVDNLLTACALDDSTTSPQCSANQLFQLVELKTSNGNTQFILTK